MNEKLIKLLDQLDEIHAELPEPLRYTNDGALAECPCCGSVDVGGAHDTVSCYNCDLTVTKPRPLQNAIDAWNTRTGRTHPAPAVRGEPVCPTCPTCYGRGWDMDCQNEFRPATCPDCAGSGKAEHSITVQESDSAEPDVAGLVEALDHLVSA